MIENNTLKLDGVIQLRGGFSSVLSTVNPLPARREIMVEIDTGKIKVGDGTHKWNDLPYSGCGMALPPSDDNSYVMKNGAWVQAGASGATLPVETSMTVTFTAQHVSQKYIALPNDCDTSRLLTVAIQGLLTEQDTDWEVSKSGTTNSIAWNGLELENIAQIGDKIFITYYKKG